MCAEQRPAPARGLSLVELMIGLVIGLLVSLTAVGSARIFGAVQRQGTVGGSGALNAAATLSAIKSDVAAAGLGFFDGRLPLCTTLNLGVGTNRLSDGAAFSPLRLVRSAGNDQLDVVYASDIAAGAHVPLRSASDGSLGEPMSTLPAAVGQTVLLAPAATGLCTVRSVTGVSAAAVDTPQQLRFASTGSHNQVSFSSAPAYPAQARLTLLGALQWHRYRVVDSNLVLEQPLEGTSAVLLRHVIGLRAEYGVAAAGSSTLQSWQDASDSGWTALNAANIGRVRALRLGVVLRSPQREKANAAGSCEASTAKPQLFGETIEPDVADWQCFRYRSATLVVPLRNLVWGQLPS